MNTSISRIGAAALALMLLTTPLAQAAPASAIGVELNDTPLSFSDAVPLARDGRTYLPFRAIFEAMGAEVNWNADTKTVSAVRDGRTLLLTLGETDVIIEENGTATVLPTDAAPFAQDGRTYVPVRFAAQALDAVVDWDGATRTVHIVDAAALLDEYDGTFTLLQKMLDTAALAWPDAPHQITGEFASSTVTQTAMGTLPVTMTGTFKGSEDRTASAFSGSCETDVDALRKAITSNEGDVIGSTIEALLTRFENFSFGTILNYETDTQYLRSENLTEFGLSVDNGGWAVGELSAYGAPLPTTAKEYLLTQAAACTLTGTDSAVTVVEAIFDEFSDDSVQDNILTSGDVTLSLNGDKLTIETALDENTTRTELLQRNARRFTLTSDDGTRVSTLTYDVTLRSGGDAPAYTPEEIS